MLDKVIEWLAIRGEDDEQLSDERVIALALIIVNNCPEYTQGTIDTKIKCLNKVIRYIGSCRVKYNVVMKEI